METRMYLCVMALALSATVQSGNVLLFPTHHHSFVKLMSILGEELKSLGHNVTVAVGAAHASIPCKYDLNIIDAGINDRRVNFPPDLLDEALKTPFTFMQSHNIFVDLASTQCETTFQSKQFWDDVENSDFDLVVVQGEADALCYLTIPHRLGVPHIVFSIAPDPSLVQIPSLPSVEQTHAVFIFDEHSTFLTRLQNLIYQLQVYWTRHPSAFDKYNFLQRFASNKPPTTINNLYQNSEMWIFHVDTVCLDFPRVEAPHARYISGIHLEPARLLPQEFRYFADSAENGLVVVSMGSGMGCLPKTLLDGILVSCLKSSVKYVVRHECEIRESYCSNVMVSPWLPQNDLLGHKNTKLFITHGGSNGMQEAIYHGVPVIAMPIMLDQWYNAKLASVRGYGLVLDKLTVKTNVVSDSITEVLTNQSYSENIKRCSQKIRHLPNPRQKVAKWIEHVMLFGSKHLKPRFYGMSVWQYYMLDIVGVFLVTGTFLLWCNLFCYRRYFIR